MHTQLPQLWDVTAHVHHSCHSCGMSPRMRTTFSTVGRGARQHPTAVIAVGCIRARIDFLGKSFEIRSILLRPKFDHRSCKRCYNGFDVEFGISQDRYPHLPTHLQQYKCTRVMFLLCVGIIVLDSFACLFSPGLACNSFSFLFLCKDAKSGFGHETDRQWRYRRKDTG